MEQSIPDVAATVVRQNRVLELLEALVAEGVDIAVIHNYVCVIAGKQFDKKRLKDPKYPYGWLK